MKLIENNRKSIDDPVVCVMVFFLILGLLLLLVYLKQYFKWQIVYGYLFFLGWFSWTFLEYMFHRFVWHSKRSNKGNSKTDTSNHLYHHQHPSEIKMTSLTRSLLAIGCLLLAVISIFKHNYLTIITGFICGFTFYNFTHWLLHQKFSERLFPKKVRYHIYHHCRYPDKCFGISISWWDDLFGTVPGQPSIIRGKVVDFYFGEKMNKTKTSIKKELVILIILLSGHFYSPAQDKKLHYDVIRNGKVIGFVDVSEKTNGNVVFLQLKSNVKTKFLAFPYNSAITENAVFEDGVMIYSFYYKNENGTETSVEAKKYNGSFDIVENGHENLHHQSPSGYNTLQLYCDSPGINTKAYSNHFQQFLEIKKVAPNRYRLALPDDKYNYFNYKNGICIRVDIERSLFTIHFVLRN